MTTGMGLQEIGVQLDGHGYVICGDDDQTNIPGIFAIGDVIQVCYWPHYSISFYLDLCYHLHNTLCNVGTGNRMYRFLN